jgi:hypothetical protein
MKMPADLAARGAARGPMPEDEAADCQFIDNAAAEMGGGRRVTVAGDPYPIMHADEAGEESGVGRAQPVPGCAIVEAVAKADDGFRALVMQQQGEPLEAGASVIRRQQGAMPGEAGPLFEVEVGDDDGAAARPDQRAARVGGPGRRR